MAINFNGVRIKPCAGGGAASPSNNITSFETITGDSYTKFLAHFDGADGSTSFTDDSSNPGTGTFSGAAVIKTAQSKFGGSSLYFNGNNASKFKCTNTNNKVNFGPTGGSSFTIELWFYYISLIPWTSLIHFNTSAWYQGPALIMNNAGQLYLENSYGGSFHYAVSPGWVPPTGQWHHIAIVGTSGQHIKIYINGTLYVTRAGSYFLSMPSAGDIGLGHSLSLPGGLPGDTGVRTINGYIDEVRFSDTARYSANFTPSTSAFGTGVLTYPTAELGKMAKDNNGFLYECTDAAVPTWRRYTLG
jgi:hypothetical protein